MTNTWCRARLACVAMTLLLVGVSRAELPAQRIEITHTADGKIMADGQVFNTWNDYANSTLFQSLGLRCATHPSGVQVDGLRAGAADCTYSWTNPDSAYDPSVVKYMIPVVVHVIRNSTGTQGDISAAMVQSQIDILNEDYLALPGTNGGNGTDLQIQFYLATTDPSGNPTAGITYSNNNTWYNDSGNYWDSLAWDTNRYLNIYTNTAQGYLGYVPDLPQGGIVGSNEDRVVILWSSFGRNAPIGTPYDQGRTATHEIGHYLGLFHPFTGNCPSVSNCHGNGDLICDTNPEYWYTSGCSNTDDCGYPAPIENYMDYSDDLCMTEFTQEQARRIRCTLEHYRPNLYTIAGCSGDGDCDDGVFCNGAETCNTGTGDCAAGSDPCPGQVCDEAGAACVECLNDADCEDSLFCNGNETCDLNTKTCLPGSDPCPGQVCDEAGAACVECLNDADCEDSLFCNGNEMCDLNTKTCLPGSDPCPGQGCDELSDTCATACVSVDVNCDGVINGVDMGVIKQGANWNQSPPANPRADVNGDGVANGVDMGIIKQGANWNVSTGPCICP